MRAADDPKVQFNVYLPRELSRTVKHRAIDADMSLSAYVERVLRAAVEDPATGATPTINKEQS